MAIEPFLAKMTYDEARVAMIRVNDTQAAAP